MTNSDFESRMIVRDWDKDTFDDRLKRYLYLDDLEDYIKIPALDGLSSHYKNEAGACYVQGNFVASIIMVGATVDAFLRAIIRSKYHHESGYVLNNGKYLDDLNLSQVFDEALAEGYITEDEYKVMHHIIKDIWEPYMHTKTNLIDDPSLPIKAYDPNDKEIKRNRPGLASFDLQKFKITDPWLVGGKGVEEEAREALYLLAKLMPNILLRHTYDPELTEYKKTVSYSKDLDKDR